MLYIRAVSPPIIRGCEFLDQLSDCFSIRNYLVTPWSRVLLEKLTGSQLVKTFHAFHGTRRFITAFTSARHLFLS